MSYALSEPIENLIENPEPSSKEVDVLIVGSGYGGSVAAMRLANEKEGRSVYVLERGKEYQPGDFPKGLGDIPGFIHARRQGGQESIGYPEGLFDFHIGEDIDVLVGSGLGGTSLINANVAARPDSKVFRNWPREIRGTDDAPINPLCAEYGEIERWLDVKEAQTTPKTAALQTLATNLGGHMTPARIAVTYVEGDNHAGVKQNGCIYRGNCVTGCNQGAKNTLAMNLIPLARERGAQFFTGATVMSVAPGAPGKYPWKVRYRRTCAAKTPLAAQYYEISAGMVILSAGTLGSTEILARSQALGLIELSQRLGWGFSTNGDAIAAGFGQRAAVNAMSDAATSPGPTISGMIHKEARDPRTDEMVRLTIEDASIPEALVSLFGDLITTGAQLNRLTDDSLPAWLKDNPTMDPLAVHQGALAHSQALLIMGDDGARGKLSFRAPESGDFDRAHVEVGWRDFEPVGKNRALRAADALLAAQDRKDGFDGGQYVANPLWRPLPEAAAKVFSGAVPGGRVITVHPMGGCGMGDDVESGVVDHSGQVFRAGSAAAGSCYEGLYVLDGAILPAALGVNPFLTIAALSWRACTGILGKKNWGESKIEKVPRKSSDFVDKKEDVATSPAAVAGVNDTVELVIKEQLIGKIEASKEDLESFNEDFGRWAADSGFVMRVELKVADIEKWMSATNNAAIDAVSSAKAQLYANLLNDKQISNFRLSSHVPGRHLNLDKPIATLSGQIRYLKQEPVSSLQFHFRTAMAVLAYVARRLSRPSLAWAVKSIQSWLTGRFCRVEQWFDGPKVPSKPAGLSWCERFRRFLAVARAHADYRVMEYELAGNCNGVALTITGTKRLAYAPFKARLWDSLVTLPAEFTFANGQKPTTYYGTLSVDMEHMLTEGVPQLAKASNLPRGVAALARFAGFFARCIFQTSFWEFAGAPYPNESNPQVPLRGPQPLRVDADTTIAPELVNLQVPISDPNGETIEIRLLRYRRQGRPPVLLVHGLAQGSLIYTTDTIDKNMAQAMWEAGYDVWLLDYRLSNVLIRSLPTEGWGLEDIARHDLPAAVNYVFEACGSQPVRLFAHCVGATVITMAVLKNWVQSDRLARVAINAIHPWITTSPVNRCRALLGSAFRDLVGTELLDPIPQRNPSALQGILDRLAFSFGRYSEQDGDRHASGDVNFQVICDRMTFLYGRMWHHANLDPRTHEAFAELFGPSTAAVYNQLYYFSRRGFVTDSEGQNAFLTQDAIDNYWNFPTLFLHGEISEVFNAHSATRSASRLRHALKNSKSPWRRVYVGHRRINGYGHMDVIFGRNACKDVYPHLIQFFEEQDWRRSFQPLKPGADVHPDQAQQLASGPILRAAWFDSDRVVRLRRWQEDSDALLSTLARERAANQGNSMASSRRIGDWMYRMLDTEVNALNPSELASLRHLPWLDRLKRRAAGGRIQKMSFLVGSCRYPGTAFDRVQSDAVFAGMLSHIRGSADEDKESEGSSKGVDLMFLIGDQIYADATASILDSNKWRERYSARYRETFGSAKMRAVLKMIPTHFAIDDHEFSDDWSGLPGKGKSLPFDEHANREFKLAKRAARNYQSSGRRAAHPCPSTATAATTFWYALNPDCESVCPAFVMDTRSERQLRVAGRKGAGAQIAGTLQRAALYDWLQDSQRRFPDHPKFLFSGVVIAPVCRDFLKNQELWRREDGWAGYPGSLGPLTEFIVANGIQNVVFVSGDLHFSAVGRLELTLPNYPSVTAWQIVSSGLYSPMPFSNADPLSFDWNNNSLMMIKGSAANICANVGLLAGGDESSATPAHFVRVDAEQSEMSKWRLKIAAIGADGMALAPVSKAPPGATAVGKRWIIDL